MLSRDAYSAVPDFEWALSVLVDLAYVICGSPTAATSAGITTATFPPRYNTNSGVSSAIDGEIAALFRDIAVRVRVVRPFGAALAARCVADDGFWALGAWEVTSAAVWICGEYAA